MRFLGQLVGGGRGAEKGGGQGHVRSKLKSSEYQSKSHSLFITLASSCGKRTWERKRLNERV